MDRAFEMSIVITPNDIDVLGHVNNVVYLRWVQDVAVAHWLAIATDAHKRDLLWVVVRHEIDYKRPAMPEDGVIARTWLGEAEPRAFARHTELLRASDRKLLARARTLWCPVDPETKRAVDVDPAEMARYARAGADVPESDG